MSSSQLTVGLAQIAPIWLDKAQTLDKILSYVSQAADQGCQLVTFGETLLPGYPFWIEWTEGARFNSDLQKEWYALYLDQSIKIYAGELDALCALAKEKKIAVYVGVLERAMERGNHSVYCSLVYVDAQGDIQSVHRKLMPTYEERLFWATGDGHGLRVHDLHGFRVGGLNCWENWMPLPRATLYAQGENVHVAVWPGNVRNTIDLTRHIAVENRSYVISVSGLMRRSDIPDTVPEAEALRAVVPDFMANGGSCVAAPDGSWVIEPIAEKETLAVATLDEKMILRERHNFDPSGHYSRPDVFQLKVNRDRQQILDLEE
ncbi:MAG: carbon-nitrogen hydrolase family protein [Bacteroidota bacterium]